MSTSSRKSMKKLLLVEKFNNKHSIKQLCASFNNLSQNMNGKTKQVQMSKHCLSSDRCYKIQKAGSIETNDEGELSLCTERVFRHEDSNLMEKQKLRIQMEKLNISSTDLSEMKISQKKMFLDLSCKNAKTLRQSKKRELSKKLQEIVEKYEHLNGDQKEN